MASTCISSCTNTINHRAVVARASYVSLYKWPESDADFIRSMNSDNATGGSAPVIDSVSCRQMYLRSYPFSRKQTLPERTKKCLEKVRVWVYRGDRFGGFRISRVSVAKIKAVDLTCSALWDVFRRLLACTTKVDVVEYHGDRSLDY